MKPLPEPDSVNRAERPASVSESGHHEYEILGMIADLAEAGALPVYPVPLSVLIADAQRMLENTLIGDRVFPIKTSVRLGWDT